MFAHCRSWWLCGVVSSSGPNATSHPRRPEPCSQRIESTETESIFHRDSLRERAAQLPKVERETQVHAQAITSEPFKSTKTIKPRQGGSQRLVHNRVLAGILGQRFTSGCSCLPSSCLVAAYKLQPAGILPSTRLQKQRHDMPGGIKLSLQDSSADIVGPC